MELGLEPGLFLASAPAVVKGRTETTGLTPGQSQGSPESYQVHSVGRAAPSGPGP